LKSHSQNHPNLLEICKNESSSDDTVRINEDDEDDEYSPLAEEGSLLLEN